IDQLHPIEQRSWNSANVVRGRDEDDLRKIERYVEVAIDKSVVLARIEHLEQGACRVAAKVGADLIDLIKHHDRIARAGTTQLLNDASRHRTDVGAAVAPNLRFIANTAEAHPHKLPAQSIRDRLTQTGLSDSWRTEQTQNRPVSLGVQFAHREIFDQAPLYFFQIVMIAVENFLRFVEIEIVFAQLRPRQLHDRLDVANDN